MAEKRARAKWVSEIWGKNNKQKESCSNGSRERGIFDKHGGGMEIEHQQGQKEKKANSEMKRVVKNRMWVVLGEDGRRTEREND